MRLSNAPLREALRSFSDQTGASFLVADSVDEESVVALELEKQKAGEALDALLKPAGLTWRRVGESPVYLIMPAGRERLAQARRGVLADDRALDVGLRLRVGHVPFRNFLDMITAKTDVEFKLLRGKDRLRVSLDFKEVTAREALEAALDLKGLEIARSDAGGYVIREPGR